MTFLKSSREWSKSLLSMVEILTAQSLWLETIENPLSSSMKKSLSKISSNSFFPILMKSLKQDQKSQEPSRPTKNSSKKSKKEPKRNGKTNKTWERNQTLWSWMLTTGTLSLTAEKPGSSTFTKPTVRPALNSTRNGNSSQQLTREESKWLRSTWLNPSMKDWKIKFNFPNTHQSDSTKAALRKFQNSSSMKESTRDSPFKNGLTLNLRKRQPLLISHPLTRKTTKHCASQQRTLAL